MNRKLGRGDSEVEPAEQARRLGLTTGDVIVGRQCYLNDSWSEAKLKIKFIGESVIVCDVWIRCSESRCWRLCGEAGDWALDCREWELEESEAVG